MKKNFFLLLLLGVGFCPGYSQQIKYVDHFENVNHPEIGYWFVSPDLLEGDYYLRYLDTIATTCPYSLIFLTAREGADFFNTKQFHPVFEKLVAAAHRYDIKMGLQLWGNTRNVPLEHADRMIIGDEGKLDERGETGLTIHSRYIRFPDRLLKFDLFKVYAFKKKGEGFYDAGTLKDISSKCRAVAKDKQTLRVSIKAGKELAGYSVYVMTQQYCSQSSNFGADEIKRFTDALHAYGDIPFDGFALDEYGNKFVARSVQEGPHFEFRGQWYSPDFARCFAEETGGSLENTLFETRYAPADSPEIRIRAINHYMDVMRSGALRVENAVMQEAKKIFGNDIFTGIHDTYHNSLENDEIWANGIAWWKVPREYGQTDEKTSLPVQMGVAITHFKNAMYNQYYDKVLAPVPVKALTDLRYAVRTHYHAMHDKRPNRFDLAMPEAVAIINKVENCARLLNRFNPSLPDIKLLVVFGMGALSNWYPDYGSRGTYDINEKLNIEEKAKAIWNAGYMNALVPGDFIDNGQIKVQSDGRVSLHGHVFDAVVYLYPQYARATTLQFLEKLETAGGKLMLVGNATHDFDARDVSKQFAAIAKKATVNGFDIKALPALGLQKNLLPDGCKNADGSFVFTNYPSLDHPVKARFQLQNNQNVWSGQYKGLLAISFTNDGRLQKLAAAGLQTLEMNGKIVLSFNEPTDVYFDRNQAGNSLMLADPNKHRQPVINQLQ